MTETKSKRRWFRFSLRTLFVLVTIIGVGAGWVANQLNWIRERHDFLDHYPQVYGSPRITGSPWPLSLFGEKSYQPLVVPTAALEEAKRLFPESQIIVFDDKPLFPIQLALRFTIRDVPN